MTTTTARPTVALPPERPESRELPVPLGVPTLGRDTLDPHLVLLAGEACNACDGEGSVEVEVRGGRWNPHAQGGMWEPDYVRRDCERCDGTGRLDRARCIRCGHAHASLDEVGYEYGEPECECEPEEVFAMMDEVDAYDRVLAAYRDADRAAVALGLRTSTNAFGIPWRVWLALVARHRASHVRRFGKNRDDYHTAEFGTVTAFVTTPGGA